MDTLQILKGTLALIANEENWCQGQVKVETHKGVAYCAIGAIVEVSPSPDDSRKAIKYLQEKLKTEESVSNFNDTHTHAEVKTFFESRISDLEKEQDGKQEEK